MDYCLLSRDVELHNIQWIWQKKKHQFYVELFWCLYFHLDVEVEQEVACEVREEEECKDHLLLQAANEDEVIEVAMEKSSCCSS